MEALAAEASILPWDFWLMTPGEVLLRGKALRHQEERAYHRAAWMVCYLLQPHTKRGSRLTPEKLLGKKATR
jgi:hypothetical protein